MRPLGKRSISPNDDFEDLQDDDDRWVAPNLQCFYIFDNINSLTQIKITLKIEDLDFLAKSWRFLVLQPANFG